MMMKLRSLFAGVALAAVSMTASASPWSQTIDFAPDVYIDSGGTRSWTHDLTTAGYNPGSDLITGFTLAITILDDLDDSTSPLEWAAINLPGIFDDVVWFSPIGTNITGGTDLFGFLELNSSGMLSVSLSSTMGDFYLDKSTLTASGITDGKVPEPGILALLGLGFAGLAVTRRRRPV